MARKPRRQHRRLGHADAGGAIEELAKNKGAIVNFGSISARVAQTGRWLYPVSKAAILQLTRNQAMDLAPKAFASTRSRPAGPGPTSWTS
jgi:NAD(P)-dependent dehydrogenase (short-subunit alcohol dehydrogenase family)